MGDSQFSQIFETIKDLRRGGTLNSHLFNLVVDELLDECRTKTKKTTCGHYNLKRVIIYQPACSDNLVLLGNREKDLQYNFEIWNNDLKLRTRINEAKHPNRR